jgi:site-specific DNA-methyltransferase (adenine-specific)
MIQTVHFTSKTYEWSTPQWLFDALNAEFNFTLDPCATEQNAKCANHFTLIQDGLKQNWMDDSVFMNPPYGRQIGKWMRKAYEAAQSGATVVCLTPARTDTRWWHDYAMKGEIRFLRGRIRFGGARGSAPFPSAVIVFRPFMGSAGYDEQHAT